MQQAKTANIAIAITHAKALTSVEQNNSAVPGRLNDIYWLDPA